MQSPNGFLEMADGRRVEVADGLTIGRIESCDLVLEDHKVSRRHARVIVDHGVVEIEDLGSSNGVLLNGRAVQRHILRSGDKLRIGTTDLAYTRVDPVAVSSPEVSSPAVSSPAVAPTSAERGDEKSGVEVIEFIDEVVKVRSRELPEASVGHRRSKPDREGRADHGVLQFSKQRAKRGRLSDEIGQLGGLHKFMLILAILIVSLGIAWLSKLLATA